MDGYLVPPAEALFAIRPWIENFVDNHTLVQFDHRVAAYLVIVVALLHAIDARLTGSRGRPDGRAAWRFSSSCRSSWASRRSCSACPSGPPSPIRFSRWLC